MLTSLLRQLVQAVIDHVKLFVGDFQRSLAFYEAALAPLSYRVMIKRDPPQAGLGVDFPHFWIEHSTRPTTAHVAFRVGDRATVEAFHAAALAAGATDNGPPGPRPQYHPDYFSAFVLDPDGNNIEAVCHEQAGGS
jgi:catechol 2,3-dioxygenase-like lactoylglutathione lyase family enzyme